MGIDLEGATEPGPKDASPITAVARDLEALLSARLTGLGFSGEPRPGTRCYSASFARPGTKWLACIVSVSDEQTASTSHPGTVATA